MSGRALVVGAGICGLFTGLALTRQGFHVTVLERDTPPPDGGADEAFFHWNRRGAAQFRHPHAFLAIMTHLLSRHFPDLVEALFVAGARKVTFEDMLPDDLAKGYEAQPGDEDLWLLMCRRATLETVLRDYAQKSPNLTLVPDTLVTGILHDRIDGILRLNGVTARRRHASRDEHITADLIIDAGGRNSKLRGWLQAAGANITTEDDDAEIVYYTRHYRLNPGVQEPARRGKERSAGDLGYIKYGVFPGDNGHFAVIVCLPNSETELRQAVRHGDVFDAMVRAIPGVAPWVEPGKATPTTEPFGYGDIHAVWHHFVHDDKPAALNYFAVGDAALHTNPLYGRGCSTGVIHGNLLAEVIDEEPDPVQRAVLFDQRTEAELRPIFRASLRDDQKGIRRAAAIRDGRELDQAHSVKQYLRFAFGDAIARASREQMHVLRGAIRTFNLMEKPGEFLNDWRVRLTVLRYMLYGRRHNAVARRPKGPKRDEMLKLVRQLRARSEAA